MENFGKALENVKKKIKWKFWEWESKLTHIEATD